jgi:hypothetical protein
MKDLLLKLILDALEKLITPDLQQKADEWIVARLRELADKTDNEVDDKVVELVAKALGVAVEK